MNTVSSVTTSTPTNAVTPDVGEHGKLPPLASRFVQVEALPWQQSRYAGIETKTLIADGTSGLLTSLLKMAPGARLPDHEHVEVEQTWVLEGSLECGEGCCMAGNFVWRPAGSRHDAWAGPEGARKTVGNWISSARTGSRRGVLYTRASNSRSLTEMVAAGIEEARQ